MENTNGKNLGLNHHNYVLGFTTSRGVLLDLDNVNLASVKRLCVVMLKHKRFRYIKSKIDLEGYLIIRSSPNHYHVVFNKYLTFKNALIIASTVRIGNIAPWLLERIKHGEFTIRISTKNNSNKPEIILQVGKSTSLIKDYLQIYKQFEEY